MELDIERVNLTYRNDLSIAQKIEIANSEYLFEDYMEMEKGIFIQKDEVISIVTDFLADFTGYRYDFNNAEFYAVPILVNLTYNRGTIVFWVVSCWVEPDWNFSLGIDDKTGAIISFTVSGDPGFWSKLIYDYDSFTNPYESICERYRNALYNHYSDRIGAKFITLHQVQEWNEGDVMGYRLIFRDNNDDTFEITLNISLSYGYIETI